jgi:surfeit locus 1 family protein
MPAPPAGTGGRARASVRRWAPLIATVVLAALSARLGVWQLARAAQKIALQQSLLARGALPALELQALARHRDEVVAQVHRRAVLSGHWLAERTVYLDNRPMHGRVGFYVVTPLQLADGSAVLVERGWLPRDFEDRTHITPPPTPPGDVTVNGQLAPGPARLYEFTADAGGPIRQNLDPDRFAQEIGVPLRPLSLRQRGGDAADGLARDWPAPAIDVQKHYGYAFQWFALCALTIALYVWFRILRPRRAAARRA